MGAHGRPYGSDGEPAIAEPVGKPEPCRARPLQSPAAVSRDDEPPRPFDRRRASQASSASIGWAEMMAAAQKGQEGTYRRLLDELRPWLRRYYGRRLPSAAVDDAVQDALLAIHAKRLTYDDSRPFGPWLAAIARYKWIDRLRSPPRRAEVPLSADLAVPGHGEAVLARTVLQRLMTELKPAQRHAIRLVKLEGFSVEEASRRCGQSQSLVKVNVFRGLAKLATMIEGRDDAA